MLLKDNKLINILIIISTSIIVFNFAFFVIEKSPFQYSDWLINYQGGFIRRGLPGEFFYQLYKLTNIPLDLIVFISVSLMYVFFAVNFIKIISKIKLNFLNLLIIFSPLSFLYPVMEQKVSGRKDIIFLFLVTLLATFLDKIKFEHQKYVIIFFVLISAFSHTGFVVFTPIFFLLFIIANYKNTLSKIFKELIIISFFSIILLILILFNTSIDNQSIFKICDSIKNFLPNCGQDDYIETVSWSLKYAIELNDKLWIKENYASFYTLTFLFANAPLIYAFYKSKLNKKYSFILNPIFIFIFINLMSLPIYFVGVDYGRYINITYLSLLIFYFKALSTKFFVISEKFNDIKKPVAFLIIFLFGFTWTVPHCCNTNLKFIYQKPISNIIDSNKN
jgi:hypothetical protein